MRVMREGELAAATTAGATGAPGRSQRIVMAAAVAVGFVLRWWDLGGPVATFDESFTGAYSHLPIRQIPGALRQNDAHPPFDYLIRHFFGSMGDTTALRVPSAIFGCAALAVVVWWMWDRGWFGVAMVALTSLSPFQLLYAHQARMYALAILCGTAAAALADRWSRDGARRWRWLLVLPLLVGLFDLSTFLLFAGALVLLPGRRRDREAWLWRATAAACGAVWAVVWGPSFLHQAQGQHSDWIRLTSPAAVRDTIAGFLTVHPNVSLLAVAIVIVGAVMLWRQDRVVWEVWAWLALLPFALACVLGLRSHFLLTRALAPSAWGIPLVLAALFDRARRYSPLAEVVVVAALVLVSLPSIGPALAYEEGAGPGVVAVAARVQPGDGVLVYPHWLWPLVVWSDAAPRVQTVPAALHALSPDAYIYVAPGAPFGGRVWILQPTGYRSPTTGLARCPGRTPVAGDYSLTCYQLSSR